MQVETLEPRRFLSSVSGLSLMQAGTSSTIAALHDGDTFASGSYGIRAIVGTGFGSVLMDYDGSKQTESVLPADAFGTTSSNGSNGRLITAGSHTLTLTAYSGAGLTGTASAPQVFHFTGTTAVPPVPPAVSSVISFPADAGLIDVKARYGAKGDGVTDDTAAIQRAISENICNYNNPKTLYFAPGTYLVSNKLDWKNTLGQSRAYLVLQGSGKGATTIKLKDNAPGFGDPASPKSVIYTRAYGPRPLTSGWNPADGDGDEAFDNSLYDLTIDTGKGNPGAIGINYLVNNKGTLRNVDVRSGDGAGVAGISMLRAWPGPGLIENVSVNGFNYGIDAGQQQSSMTLESITVRGQKVAGIHDAGQILNIHNLTSVNTVPAVQSTSWLGLVTLVDANLSGGVAGAVAVQNSGGAQMLARNVTASGYGYAITGVSGLTVAEYSTTKRSVFASSNRTLGLTIQSAPVFQDPDMTHWGAVKRQAGESDDTAAIQRAIDSGKSTVYFPSGRYTVSGTIHVRGNVQRIMGFDSSIQGPGGGSLTNPSLRKGIFSIEQTTSPSVIIERLNSNDWGGGGGWVWFDQTGSESLVLRDISLGSGTPYRSHAGSGNVFIEDVSNFGGGSWEFGNGQSVWARQLDSESPISIPNGAAKIINNGANVWILGLKTEMASTIIETKGGGSTELLGASFNNNVAWSSTLPAFIDNESRVSLTYAENAYTTDSNIELHVRETRAGVTKDLLRSAVLSRGLGSSVALFCGA